MQPQIDEAREIHRLYLAGHISSAEALARIAESSRQHNAAPAPQDGGRRASES